MPRKNSNSSLLLDINVNTHKSNGHNYHKSHFCIIIFVPLLFLLFLQIKNLPQLMFFTFTVCYWASTKFKNAQV